eukprot:CAMPEP_0177612146 /NCGR_PEP_ID=MMETSP0419_2-20121207/21010_1 /TAXON_ID=582737 /ORGANISM="Tetraselmis sp., Strain GSL018" /LENGTH=423 /DNA_ID=CAMNT_0019108205 /DNA_START=258 /DNA_END=1529 /DNA_ORIENTATION=+
MRDRDSRREGAQLETETPITGNSRPRKEKSEKSFKFHNFSKMLAAAALPALSATGGGIFGTGFDLSGPESVAEALGLLAIIVAVHEAGHFAAARLQGIHVKRFSIGFGPVVAKYQGPKVEYAVRALPLGGYVAFPDDDPESEYADDDPDLLKNRPISQRVIVISAGVIANFIFAFGILFAQVSTVGVGSPEFLPGVKVAEVIRSSAAERSGIRGGDIITAVNEAPLPADRAEVDRLVRQIKRSDGIPMSFRIERAGEAFKINAIPELAEDGYGRMGMQLVSNAKINRERARSPGEAAAKAFREELAMVRGVSKGLYQIFANFQQKSQEVSGPVAIVAVGAEVARNDASGLFQFAALVNVNLGVVNLLPLPGLDGGYLALAAVEAARGEKLKREVEGAIQGGGFLILLTSGVILILRDAVNLLN